MTADRRLLNAAILSTLCALTMATSAKADALSDYRTAVKADTPLAYWQLDETTGTSCDGLERRRGYTGTFAGGVTLGAAPPFSAPANKAVRFDAAGTMTAQVPGTAKEVEFWVRPSQRVQQTFVSFGDPAAGGWSIGLSGSKTTRNQRRRINFTSGGHVTSARMSLAIGSWSMVAVSWGPGQHAEASRSTAAASRARPSRTALPTSSASLGALVVGPGAGSGGTTVDEVALFGTRPDSPPTSAIRRSPSS